MKHGLLLHAELSQVVAAMGHGDMLVLGDAGLPIPGGPTRIDLAVSPGTPGMAEVLRAVLSELAVESSIIASEALAASGGELPPWCAGQLRIPPHTVSHEAFKQLCKTARAIVRTGECTPYANVILVAGVTF